jgi:predicted GNAT superfamily acetyltransferase
VGGVSEWSPERDLAAAEERAAVEVRTLTDLSDLEDARRVFDAVWPAEATQVQPNLLKALVHAGGYCSAAYRDGRPIGAALGFVGRHEREGWHDHLHSHMAAVLDPYRDQHIGSALKLHQRAWALDRSIDTIVWTFDPLVRRNAVLNLLKLGVDVEGYEIDFYGSMSDAINADDPTDRVFAWWRLTSPRAMDASLGRLRRIDIGALEEEGRQVIGIDMPEDIVALRATDPAEAAWWRQRVRNQLVLAFEQGWQVIGVGLDDEYALEHA